jgi:hypothetical protein
MNEGTRPRIARLIRPTGGVTIAFGHDEATPERVAA